MSWKNDTKSEGKLFPFSLPKMGKNQWFVVLLLGILLAVIALPAKEEPDEPASASFPEEKESEAGTKERMERDLEELLSQVEGVGEVRVLLSVKEESTAFYAQEEAGLEVTGVLIASSGAEDLSVVQNITEAVQALFQVEAHKIKVMKMK